jgi:hypothetical protein
MKKTCFVVMAIGAQKGIDYDVSYNELNGIYQNVIKEAILKADSNLDVVRADEVSSQGTITTDILTRLMHSDYVIADITYPNANVFYELGIRHCCKVGTIIIKNSEVDTKTPFDVNSQRYISYQNSPSGIKNLAAELSKKFQWFTENPNQPDNHLLDHAKSSKYKFPQYSLEVDQKREEGIKLMVEGVFSSDIIIDMVLDALSKNPDMNPLHMLMFKGIGDVFKKDKHAAEKILEGAFMSGLLNSKMLGIS